MKNATSREMIINHCEILIKGSGEPSIDNDRQTPVDEWRTLGLRVLSKNIRYSFFSICTLNAQGSWDICLIWVNGNMHCPFLSICWVRAPHTTAIIAMISSFFELAQNWVKHASRVHVIEIPSSHPPTLPGYTILSDRYYLCRDVSCIP